MHPPAILLMGPTASGKSALSMRLAERWPIEIISVDSAQVYRDMDIGTAKPGQREREQVPHHLIDVVGPNESYSAARFSAEATAAMDAIQARNRVPVLVGGTMLYFRALTAGLSTLPPADPAVRAEIDARAVQHGWPQLHAELAQVDSETAQRLQPLDRQRIQRALEVYRITGQPLSRLLQQRRSPEPKRRFVPIALIPSQRSTLHQRIAQRFHAMLEAGLVEEVRMLRQRYVLDPALPSMRAVGYRQAWQYLDGEIELPALREQGVFATRQLAKRQLTWLRSTAAHAFDCLAPTVESEVVDWLAQELPGAWQHP